MFIKLDIVKKIGQNLFFTGKVSFFFSEICVFNNLLGVTEMILYLPQDLSKKFVDPFESSPEVYHTR